MDTLRLKEGSRQRSRGPFFHPVPQVERRTCISFLGVLGVVGCTAGSGISWRRGWESQGITEGKVHCGGQLWMTSSCTTNTSC